ncbi:hypothetical protein [Winogradskyella sp.]|jgi:glucan phosphoethanolaminetransferase (alkaline phosphatase superfamily)|uniref:hypothetical protein n=1 Tax=Winogradskyella sp. TaxID=1883156 RepID=UPI0025DAA1B3|nr:hypothetical protein [Winogradskyella sp.]MCT4628411.1 hypothetical protein [Winogradskyella sp.]
MKKLKLKPFIIIFFILMVIQFIIVYVDVQLTKSESSLTSITNPVITIFSLPINGIHRNLPFYVHESLYIRAMYWVVNLFIQSAVIYLGILSFKRVRKKLK